MEKNENGKINPDLNNNNGLSENEEETQKCQQQNGGEDKSLFPIPITVSGPIRRASNCPDLLENLDEFLRPNLFSKKVVNLEEEYQQPTNLFKVDSKRSLNTWNSSLRLHKIVNINNSLKKQRSLTCLRLPDSRKKNSQKMFTSYSARTQNKVYNDTKYKLKVESSNRFPTEFFKTVVESESLKIPSHEETKIFHPKNEKDIPSIKCRSNLGLGYHHKSHSNSQNLKSLIDSLSENLEQPSQLEILNKKIDDSMTNFMNELSSDKTDTDVVAKCSKDMFMNDIVLVDNLAATEHVSLDVVNSSYSNGTSECITSSQTSENTELIDTTVNSFLLKEFKREIESKIQLESNPAAARLPMFENNGGMDLFCRNEELISPTTSKNSSEENEILPQIDATASNNLLDQIRSFVLEAPITGSDQELYLRRDVLSRMLLLPDQFNSKEVLTLMKATPGAINSISQQDLEFQKSGLQYHGSQVLPLYPEINQNFKSTFKEVQAIRVIIEKEIEDLKNNYNSPTKIDSDGIKVMANENTIGSVSSHVLRQNDSYKPPELTVSRLSFIQEVENELKEVDSCALWISQNLLDNLRIDEDDDFQESNLSLACIIKDESIRMPNLPSQCRPDNVLVQECHTKFDFTKTPSAKLKIEKISELPKQDVEIIVAKEETKLRPASPQHLNQLKEHKSFQEMPQHILQNNQSVKLPDIKLQDITLPNVKFPDGKLPDVTFQDVTLPDVKLPDVKLLKDSLNLPEENLVFDTFPSFQLLHEQFNPAMKSFTIEAQSLLASTISNVSSEDGRKSKSFDVDISKFQNIVVDCEEQQDLLNSESNIEEKFIDKCTDISLPESFETKELAEISKTLDNNSSLKYNEDSCSSTNEFESECTQQPKYKLNSSTAHDISEMNESFYKNFNISYRPASIRNVDANISEVSHKSNTFVLPSGLEMNSFLEFDIKDISSESSFFSEDEEAPLILHNGDSSSSQRQTGIDLCGDVPIVPSITELGKDMCALFDDKVGKDLKSPPLQQEYFRKETCTDEQLTNTTCSNVFDTGAGERFLNCEGSASEISVSESHLDNKNLDYKNSESWNETKIGNRKSCEGKVEYVQTNSIYTPIVVQKSTSSIAVDIPAAYQTSDSSKKTLCSTEKVQENQEALKSFKVKHFLRTKVKNRIKLNENINLLENQEDSFLAIVKTSRLSRFRNWILKMFRPCIQLFRKNDAN